MYFSHRPTLSTPTKCLGCGDWYVMQDGPHTACAVSHGPGECCHQGETKVDPPPTEPRCVTCGKPKSEHLSADWLCPVYATYRAAPHPESR